MKNYHSQVMLLRWTACIISILFSLFISVFALDAFSEGIGFWKTLLVLIMHLFPTFMVLFITWLAWRWEWVGGISFTILDILYIVIS